MFFFGLLLFRLQSYTDVAVSGCRFSPSTKVSELHDDDGLAVSGWGGIINIR